MPSPFPGMNPYLEQPGLWRDFHQSYLLTVRTLLTPKLVPRYVVKLEESLYLDTSDDRRRMFAVADASITPGNRPRLEGAGAVLTETAPVTSRVQVKGVRRWHRRWLTIRNKVGGEIVTVIELFSPSDKRPGPDRERYLAKRDRVLRSSANLVEIDLLRGGARMPVENPPVCDYLVLRSRRADRPQVGLWPVGLRDRLPSIPVPLKSDDAEPLIDLQEVLHRVYDEAGYAYHIYGNSPEPELSAPDAAWANGMATTA